MLLYKKLLLVTFSTTLVLGKVLAVLTGIQDTTVWQRNGIHPENVASYSEIL